MNSLDRHASLAMTNSVFRGVLWIVLIAVFFSFLPLSVVNAELSPTDQPHPAKKRGRIKTAAHHASGDFKETFTSWPVLVIAGGAGLAGLAYTFDDAWQKPFQDGATFDTADQIAGIVGSPYALTPSVLVVYGLGKLTHNEKLASTGETLTEALAITYPLTLGLKYTINRTRPNGDSHSFPSAHAAGNFAIASSLATLYGPKAGVPAFLVAGLIGASRIDSNHHFTSDVVFGAALGSAIGWGTARFHRREHDHIWILPQATQRQAGLSFLYTF